MQIQHKQNNIRYNCLTCLLAGWPLSRHSEIPWQRMALMSMLSNTHNMPVVLVLMQIIRLSNSSWLQRKKSLSTYVAVHCFWRKCKYSTSNEQFWDNFPWQWFFPDFTMTIRWQLTQSLTFPWHVSNSLTFQVFQTSGHSVLGGQFFLN